MTTAVLALLSVEIGAILLLLGAQVIAEYERIGREPPTAAQRGLRTDSDKAATSDAPGG